MNILKPDRLIEKGDVNWEPKAAAVEFMPGRWFKRADYICDNAHCIMHQPLPVCDADAPYVDILKGDMRVRVNRFQYARRSDNRPPIYFCDSCHAAVNLIMRPDPKALTYDPAPCRVTLTPRL